MAELPNGKINSYRWLLNKYSLKEDVTIMADVKIYTTPFCPFCIRAKQLLDSKGVSYDEIRVDKQPGLRAEMESRSGRHTVPQIWIGDQHVGGNDDLWALDRKGKLDDLLSA